MTYDFLLKRMLEKVVSINPNLDIREGSLVWLGNAPAAVELQNLYIALDTVLKETFAHTASRDFLILRAAERGLVPYPATAAILELTITPSDLTLPLYTRFSIGTLNYFVSHDIGDGKYEITCETVGEIGNDYADTVIPIEYIAGLATCDVTALLIPGEDAEDTEAFRQRYMDSLQAQAFGGNRADYIEKVNAIQGVGGVKVYRAWNSDIRPATLIPPEGAGDWIAGTSAPEQIQTWLEAVYAAAKNSKLTVGGTVRLVIIDSTYSVPSEALVELVQTTIDPLQNAGEGVGLAPIGHVVKVEAVQTETINLTFHITYQEGWIWEDVLPHIQTMVQAYFTELAKTWAEESRPLVVRISQIESRLLEIDGILDVMDTQVNGAGTNYTLQTDCIPLVGMLTEQG